MPCKGLTTIVATGAAWARDGLMREVEAAQRGGHPCVNVLLGTPPGAWPDSLVCQWKLRDDAGKAQFGVLMDEWGNCGELAPALSERHPHLTVACSIRNEGCEAEFDAFGYLAGVQVAKVHFPNADCVATRHEAAVHFHPATPAHEAAAAAFLKPDAFAHALTRGEACGHGWVVHRGAQDEAGASDEAQGMFLLARPWRPGDLATGGTAIRLAVAGDAGPVPGREGFVAMAGVSPAGGYESAARLRLRAAAAFPEVADVLAQALRGRIVARREGERQALAIGVGDSIPF